MDMRMILMNAIFEKMKKENDLSCGCLSTDFRKSN